jgi:hypothetical protein
LNIAAQHTGFHEHCQFFQYLEESASHNARRKPKAAYSRPATPPVNTYSAQLQSLSYMLAGVISK